MYKNIFKIIPVPLLIILAISITACDTASIPPSSSNPPFIDTPISKNPSGMEIRLAPIHDVDVRIAESYPPQVFVYIKGGLPDGCTSFHDIKIKRTGNTINIKVTIQRKKDAMCTQLYGYFEKNIGLGSDFISGKTYIIKVNERTVKFVMP